ncbi:MAG: ShlB/FhaC/HecB family hemolysin secretion/activation protein, partial [Rhodocyclaceae bacterium]|nr:ShlB/FhaC/HecB family hemolysin secretion/activation protein [Rhodocyclaceae bacterium]
MSLSTPRPACLLPVLALLVAVLAGAAGADAARDLPRFDILEFRVEGNSRLTEIDIEAAVLPHLGEQRTLLDVDAARGALEKAYHEAGYMTVVVSIPDQKVDEGVVTLAVVEGEVGRLRVKGAEYHLPSGIRGRVPELAEGRVPHFPSMQKELADLNRNPDLKATPVLRAGRYPGQVDVQLEVEDHLPLHGSLDYSN